MPRARFRNPESIVPYKFGGNELYTDSGLNLYDFKARMYDPTIGHFTSIDPKAEKYFSISPYAYCNNNPVIFVDPDGEEIIVGNIFHRTAARIGIKGYTIKVYEDLAALINMDPILNTVISQLESSEVSYRILPTSFRPRGKKGNAYNHHKKIIYYDPYNESTVNGNKRPPQVGLAHELGHAENDMNGKRIEADYNKADLGDKQEQEKVEQNEQNSLDKENIVRLYYNIEKKEHYRFKHE